MENIAEMVGETNMVAKAERREQPGSQGGVENQRAQSAIESLRARPSIGAAAIDELAKKVAEQGVLLARFVDSYKGVDLGAASWSDIGQIERVAAEIIEKAVGKTQIGHELGKKLFDTSAPGHAEVEFPEDAFAIKVALSGSEEANDNSTSAEMQVWMRDDWEFYEILSQFDGQAEGWGVEPMPEKVGPKADDDSSGVGVVLT